MMIHLGKLGSEPCEWQEVVAIAAAKLERTQLLELSEVRWRGRIWEESPGFRLEASYSYEQTVACDRCLSPTTLPVEGDVRLLLIANTPQPTDEEVELTEEDLEILYLDGEEVDPNFILVEVLQLNVPMRVICKESCQGLCPECGVNRNLESCGCEEARIDPRWEALRGLRKDN